MLQVVVNKQIEFKILEVPTQLPHHSYSVVNLNKLHISCFPHTKYNPATFYRKITIVRAQKTTTMSSLNNTKRTFSSGALLTLAICMGIGITFSCKKAAKKVTPVCDGTNATYTNTVKSIVDGNCISCHSGYSSYTGLSTITTNGKFTQHVLSSQDMPQAGPLSADQLNKLQCWVNNGYPQ